MSPGPELDEVGLELVLRENGRALPWWRGRKGAGGSGDLISCVDIPISWEEEGTLQLLKHALPTGRSGHWGLGRPPPSLGQTGAAGAEDRFRVSLAAALTDATEGLDMGCAEHVEPRVMLGFWLHQQHGWHRRGARIGVCVPVILSGPPPPSPPHPPVTPGSARQASGMGILLQRWIYLCIHPCWPVPGETPVPLLRGSGPLDSYCGLGPPFPQRPRWLTSLCSDAPPPDAQMTV